MGSERERIEMTEVTEKRKKKAHNALVSKASTLLARSLATALLSPNKTKRFERCSAVRARALSTREASKQANKEKRKEGC